jgi:hypothetical protein
MMFSIQDDGFDVHIAEEYIRLVVIVLVGADGFRFKCAIEVMDGIFDQIDPKLCHDAGVGHVPDVDFSDLHIALAVFLEVEAVDAMRF